MSLDIQNIIEMSNVLSPGSQEWEWCSNTYGRVTNYPKA